MLLGVWFLPGFSLAVPRDQSLPLALIIVQSVVFAGMFLLLFRLQKIGGPVLLSLLGSVGDLVGVPVAIFLQDETPPEGLILGAALIDAGVALLPLGTDKSEKPINTTPQVNTSKIYMYTYRQNDMEGK